jgi:hypothetical protein
MSLTLLGFEIVLFLAFLLLKVPDIGKIFLPLLCLMLSTFVAALSGKAGFLAQVSSGFSAVAMAYMASDLVKKKFGFSLKNPSGRLGGSSVIYAIGLLLILLIAHIAFSFDRIIDPHQSGRISAANPWGIPAVLAIILFALLNKSSIDLKRIDKLMFFVVAIASVILGLLEFAIVLGIIPGNTSKVAENMGGRGLANWSTNETGILACSLLLWNMRSLYAGKRRTFIAFGCVVLNLSVVVLTKGRIALAAASILILAALFASRARVLVKVSVLLPILVVFAILAVNVILQRTSAEFAGTAGPQMTLENMPGSGRPIVWFYYVDAFIYSARAHPYYWIVGVGSAGLLSLYDLSPLQKLGHVIEHVEFYPLHSDFVNVFLISGFLGLLCWMYLIWWFWKVPKRKDQRAIAFGALGSFTLFMAVDMVNYLLVASVLIFYAVVSSIDSAKLSITEGK